MKKRKLALTGLIGFAFLFGCNQVDTTNEVKASLPEGFARVSETKLGGVEFVEVEHIETKCRYIFKTDDMEQMFIEKDGASVPYCDKVGE